MYTSTNSAISFVLLEEEYAENLSMKQKLFCFCLEIVLFSWILKYSVVAEC